MHIRNFRTGQPNEVPGTISSPHESITLWILSPTTPANDGGFWPPRRRSVTAPVSTALFACIALLYPMYLARFSSFSWPGWRFLSYNPKKKFATWPMIRNDVMGREESHLHGTSTLRKGNSYFTGDLFPCFHVDVYLISLVIAPFANAALPTPVSALTWSGIFLSYLPRPCCR